MAVGVCLKLQVHSSRRILEPPRGARGVPGIEANFNSGRLGLQHKRAEEECGAYKSGGKPIDGLALDLPS